jgi:hypothetical protein
MGSPPCQLVKIPITLIEAPETASTRWDAEIPVSSSEMVVSRRGHRPQRQKQSDMQRFACRVNPLLHREAVGVLSIRSFSDRPQFKEDRVMKRLALLAILLCAALPVFGDSITLVPSQFKTTLLRSCLSGPA